MLHRSDLQNRRDLPGHLDHGYTVMVLEGLSLPGLEVCVDCLVVKPDILARDKVEIPDQFIHGALVFAVRIFPIGIKMDLYDVLFMFSTQKLTDLV